jgi:hypothetical protein
MLKLPVHVGQSWFLVRFVWLRQYNNKKKDRQYNNQKKDRQYNKQKKDRQI